MLFRKLARQPASLRVNERKIMGLKSVRVRKNRVCSHLHSTRVSGHSNGLHRHLALELKLVSHSERPINLEPEYRTLDQLGVTRSDRQQQNCLACTALRWFACVECESKWVNIHPISMEGMPMLSRCWPLPQGCGMAANQQAEFRPA